MKIRKPFLLIVIMAILGMFITCGDPDKSDSQDSTTDGKGTYYTVSFVANGGSPAPQNQTIKQGGKVTEPAAMTKTDYGFDGWYKETTFNNLWNFNSDTVTESIVLYAKWEYLVPIIVQGETLAEQLQWLKSNAESNNDYILKVSNDESLEAQNLYYSGKNNISIQLIGIGGVKTIQVNGSVSLFTIRNGVTLIIDENISLRQGSNNLVEVNGGNLILNQGAKIYSSSKSGIGVYVNGGTFTMNGGEITNRRFGVYVDSGTFTMNGGEIYGNTSSSNGGWVYVSGGTFTMNGGEIYDNTVSSSSSSGGGGGVYVSNGTFTMTGGEIYDNTVSSSSYSGGGGGVYVSNGTFTMTGGEIYDNTVSSSSPLLTYNSGGGVCVSGNISSFEKTGGIITGYSSDTVNGNMVQDENGNVLDNGRGHAVYVYHNDSSFIRHKETTAGQGDNLIYIRNEPNPPTISGAWDEE